MTVSEVLRRDAEDFDRENDRLTSAIEDAEAKIVDLRRKRDDVRFRRVEALASADFLDNHGFKVERDQDGIVTVSVDPESGGGQEGAGR